MQTENREGSGCIVSCPIEGGQYIAKEKNGEGVVVAALGKVTEIATWGSTATPLRLSSSSSASSPSVSHHSVWQVYVWVKTI